LYEWLLLLHVLAAFLLVAGVTCFGVIVLGGSGEGPRRALGPPALATWNVGGIGVLVLGIWLAIEADEYAISDGWILAAIALWLIASAAGGPLSRGIRDGSGTGGEKDRAPVLLAVMAVATLALLADMILKPGA
jgi:hypothetical protein